MSQHDTLTLREALRSIQYEAASLADAQVIALQALNATYPARAALSATQPAQAAQPDAASEAFQAMADGVPVDAGWVKAQAAPNGLVMVPKKCTEAMKDVGGQFEFATISDGRLLAQSMWNELLCATPTPPAQAAADARDAERYRWLRDQANTSVNIDIGAGCEISDTLDAAIDAVLATHQQRQDDTPVKVTYTHIPAESMTLEYPGCDARIELVCVQPDIGDEQDAALIEKSWEHHEGITQ